MTSYSRLRAWTVLLVVGAGVVVAGCENRTDVDSSGAAAGVGDVQRSAAPAFMRRDAIADSSVQYYQVANEPASAEAYIKSDGSPFQVVEYGPEGMLPTEVRRPTVFVVFSQPMVPLTRLGNPMRENALMQIEPELPGVFRWMGSRILSFQPDDPMTAQLEYRVRIPEGTPALTGQVLEQDFDFSFYRESLDMVRMYPGSPESPEVIPEDDAPPAEVDEITVLFSYPVDMEFISEFLQVAAGAQAREISFSLRGPTNTDDDINRRERTVVLQLRDRLPENSQVTVTLLPGARSRPEYRGRAEASSRQFHTLRPFAYHSYNTYSYYHAGSSADDANPVFLSFSHPLASQDWNEVLKVSLPVEDLNPHVELYGDTVRLNNLPVDYDSTYTIEILSGLSDVHGRPLAVMPAGRSRVVERVEIDVPPAYSYFHTPNRGSRILEAEFPPRIIFELQNPRTGVWRVDAIDDPFSGFPAKSLVEYDMDHIQENTKHFEVVDLAEYLNQEGFGSVGVSWNFGPRLENRNVDPRRQVDLQLQVTDIGVATRYAYNQVLIWVHSLATGEPVADADVKLRNHEAPSRFLRETRTDRDGLAVIDLEPGEYSRLLVSERQQDRLEIEVVNGSDRVRFRPSGRHNAYRSGVYSQQSPASVGTGKAVPFLFTDRGLYRPGEEVTYRVIDRNLTAGEYQRFTGRYEVSVREDRWQSEPFWRARPTMSQSGGGFGVITLPEDLEPGDYVIEYRRQGMSREHRVGFQVAHFRRAAFAVQVNTPIVEQFSGERLNFSIAADYLSGGGVAAGELEYTWTRLPVRYAPPGTQWRGFAFGPRTFGYSSVVETGSDVLDDSGRAARGIVTGGEGVTGRAHTYQLEARVQDPAQQQLAGRGSALVHPARFYIGARLSGGARGWRSFTPAGEEAVVDVAAAAPDGSLFAEVDAVQAEWIERSWQSVQQRGLGGNLNTRYEAVEEVVGAQELSLSDGEAVARFTPQEAGMYILRLTGRDSDGRQAVTELTFYVTGPQWVRWLSSQPDEITLLPDQELYQVGDTAQIFVQTPIPDGRYLLTLEREGILEHSFVDIEGSAGVIDIPITEAHVPVVYAALSASSQRAEPPQSYFEPDLGKPRGFFGIVALEVAPSVRRLDVEITADKEVYRPGSDARVQVRVRSGGLPVEDAEVTLLGVDRGVLDLIDYRVPDPLDHFYNVNHFPLSVRGDDSRRLLIDPVAYETKDLQGGGGEDTKLEEREDFRPLAIFEPYLKTDEEGEAVVEFTWPDSLTTYRMTAIAVETDRFGKQEHEVSVQNPLTVRAALPQQLRVRDTASAGVILTNLTENPLEVELSLDVSGHSIESRSFEPRRVTVPAHTTEEARFSLDFASAGEVEIEFTVRSDAVNERLRERLTVVGSSVREAFTLTGSLESGEVEEAVVLPDSILPGSGELELRFTALQFDHLREPFRRWLDIDNDRNLEMLVYRAAPYALFGDALPYIVGAADAERAQRHTEWLFSRLGAYQHSDGGFVFQPYMRQMDHPSTPRTTLLGAETALWLRQHEVTTPSDLDYDRLVSRLQELAMDEDVAAFERAWALKLLSELHPQPGYGSELAAVIGLEDSLGTAGYAVGTIAAAHLNQDGISARAFDRVRNLLQIGTRSVDFVETYESRSYFDSTLLRLGAVYLAHVEREPNSVVLPSLLTAMNRAALQSPWTNSIDVLWASKAVAAAISHTDPVASTPISAALGAQSLMDERLQALHDSPVTRVFPLDGQLIGELERGRVQPLRFESADGLGAYYSATLSYALPDEIVMPRDEGFSLFRRMEDLQGNVVPWEELQSGETYRISATIGTDRNRFGAFLRIPVPSGMDVLDGSLVTTSSYDDAGGVTGGEWTRETEYGDSETHIAEGYAHRSRAGWAFYALEPQQRIYSGAVTYSFTHLYPGSRTVSFLARAVTPGVFPVPPAMIELEGEEEVFGRTHGELGIIE